MIVSLVGPPPPAFWTALYDAIEKQRLSPALALRHARRQIRATPYPAEDVGWIVRNAGPEVCLFSSDYPHVEGGRNPIKRFEESMTELGEAAKQRFYVDNFADLMGRGLPGA